jgi:anion-transporting  ArsA/GET3 family ATPase
MQSKKLINLHLVTGKGGVGKTSYSKALALELKKQNPNFEVIIFSFNDKLSACIPTTTPLFKYEHLSPESSIKQYIQQKFGPMIGHWITESHFFKALVNMIPGLSYVIVLGHIVDTLKKSPHVLGIFDAPSSGHTQVMMESLVNFQQIFQNGILFNDIHQIREFLQDPTSLHISLLGIPSDMALMEALDLKKSLKLLLPHVSQSLIINNCYSQIPHLDLAKAPSFIQNKLEMEKLILNQYAGEISATLPHILNHPIEDHLASILGAAS